MSNYTVTTDFLAKDALAPGNPSKKVKGSEFDVEFDNIATHMATKANMASPAFTGTMSLDAVNLTATFTELNTLDGITASTAELNKMDGVTATTAELNKLAGATPTTAEINYLSGVTSAIQTQLNAKAPIASPTFTGTDAGGTLTRTGTLTTSAGGIYCYGWGGSTNAGVIFLNQAATRYLYFDGTNYSMPSSGLVVGGNVTASDFIISSDARLKRDIRVLRDTGAKIDALNGYSFEFRDSGVKRIGVIAQEVKQVLPDIVHTDGDGYLKVSESALVALLIEEVKSLRTRVATLEGAK